ncbi:MAG: hypothetical protein RMZ69_29900 [Nostoc sp. ChiQUE01a]|nr:hypothetical protein [Nostoc sp. ChiQUE01a]
MEYKTGASVLCGVKTLDQYRFVPLHLWEVIPLMFWAVSDGVGFTNAIAASYGKSKSPW